MRKLSYNFIYLKLAYNFLKSTNHKVNIKYLRKTFHIGFKIDGENNKC